MNRKQTSDALRHRLDLWILAQSEKLQAAQKRLTATKEATRLDATQGEALSHMRDMLMTVGVAPAVREELLTQLQQESRAVEAALYANRADAEQLREEIAALHRALHEAGELRRALDWNDRVEPAPPIGCGKGGAS